MTATGINQTAAAGSPTCRRAGVEALVHEQMRGLLFAEQRLILAGPINDLATQAGELAVVPRLRTSRRLQQILTAVEEFTAANGLEPTEQQDSDFLHTLNGLLETPDTEANALLAELNANEAAAAREAAEREKFEGKKATIRQAVYVTCRDAVVQDGGAVAHKPRIDDLLCDVDAALEDWWLGKRHAEVASIRVAMITALVLAKIAHKCETLVDDLCQLEDGVNEILEPRSMASLPPRQEEEEEEEEEEENEEVGSQLQS